MQKIILHTSILLLLLFFLLPSISHSQPELKNKKFRILTYGLPDFAKQNSKNVIAYKWGIEFHTVAGCVVTQELQDSVAQNNDKVNSLIERKYGKDWRKQFDEEVDAEFEIEKKIEALVDKLSYIKNKQADLEKEGNGLHYLLTPIINTKKYSVIAQGWAKINGQDEWVTYYKLLVDYKEKIVKLVSAKIVKA